MNQQASAESAGDRHSTTPMTPVRRELGLITPDELAGALGLSIATVDTWRSRGGGPDYVRLGKCVHYRLDDVKRWILANLRRGDKEVA